jgi:peptide/nickel transport system permease protein
MAVLLFTGIFAPMVSPSDPYEQSLSFRNYPPTWGQERPEFNVAPNEADYDLTITKQRSAFNRAKKNVFPRAKYILGGDNLGRDVLSRIVYGARISLKVTAYALTSGIIVGSLLGLIGGYVGGWTDEILMRIVDVWTALPFILIALVIAQLFLHEGGAAEGVVIFIIALVAWTPFVRQVRADVLTIRSQDYVLAAKIAGASTTRMIAKHILPGTLSTILVIATLRVGQLILTESTLSFLGAGIPDPIPAWGKSVNDGRQFIEEAWWISFFPGFAIFLVVMSLNFFGDWFRDRLDPRLRQLD